ncbi:MAG TPA: hypothetical protein VGL69_13980 [Solirubrobacteraceae bacterium]
MDDAMARFGRERMRVGAIERRRRTAQLVYSTEGPRGLVKLIPTVARNEQERLRRTIQAAAKR